MKELGKKKKVAMKSPEPRHTSSLKEDDVVSKKSNHSGSKEFQTLDGGMALTLSKTSIQNAEEER